MSLGSIAAFFQKWKDWENVSIFKNEYDVDTDSIYQDDNKNFARGLDDVNREILVDETNSKNTISNKNKKSFSHNRNQVKPSDIPFEPKQKFRLFI